MNTWAFVALGFAIWGLTLFTFMLGYNQGRSSGYALGRSGGKLDDDKLDNDR